MDDLEQELTKPGLGDIASEQSADEDSSEASSSSSEGGSVDEIEPLPPQEGGELKVEDTKEAGFEVLGGHSKTSSKTRVHRQLPEWICKADIVESSIGQYSRPLEEFDIPSAIAKNLQKMGISQLFPVQAHVIPELLSQASGPLLAPNRSSGGGVGVTGVGVRDVCVCAPTGCGKTLCYVVPIVAALMDRVVRQVRALIVVPSQELAVQVSRVFELVSHNTSVQAGVICGHVAMETEQGMLLDSSSYPVASGVDIVVTTPGRLTEHLTRSSFASLRSLRYLVIDEADKLLGQQFQDWLPKLLAAISSSSSSAHSHSHSHSHSQDLRSILHSLCCDTDTLNLLSGPNCESRPSDTDTLNLLSRPNCESRPSETDTLNLLSRQNCESRPSDTDTLNLLSRPNCESRPSETDTLNLLSRQNCESRPSYSHANTSKLFPKVHLQKLLFSATMTHSPELLSMLSLRQPKLFTVAGAMETRDETTFTLPQSLEEVVVPCSVANKPLVLLHLLMERERGKRALCFTNSRQSTHRLCVLLRGFDLLAVAELSSSLSQGKRHQVLEQFRQGKIQVLVCSDQMSRGIDVEGVECIFSYEPPKHFRTYLHRAGRTARAGLRGVAYSLLSHNEMHSFNTMLRSVDKKKRLTEVKVSPSDIQPYLADYQAALQLLKSSVQPPRRAKPTKIVV